MTKIKLCIDCKHIIPHEGNLGLKYSTCGRSWTDPIEGRPEDYAGMSCFSARRDICGASAVGFEPLLG